MATEGTEHSMAGTRPRQPDKYNGQRDFLLLDNWLFSVDQYFILTDMPVSKQGPFVSTLLRDEALLWYRSRLPVTRIGTQLLRSHGTSSTLPCNSTSHPPKRMVSFRTSGQTSSSTTQPS